MTEITDIDIHQLLASRREIAVIWAIEDVQEVRPDLTEGQAWDVLRLVRRSHDANYGISWDSLKAAADQLFGVVANNDPCGG